MWCLSRIRVMHSLDDVAGFKVTLRECRAPVNPRRDQGVYEGIVVQLAGLVAQDESVVPERRERVIATLRYVGRPRPDQNGVAALVTRLGAVESKYAASTIVALPDQMFYNTGIATYIWVVTNRKRKERRGKVQLINATDLFVKMRKSLGNQRNELSNDNIAEIVRLYGDVTINGRSKVFDNSDFGYHQITVERPLRLAFQVTPERISLLKEKSAFRKLATSKKKGKEAQKEIEAGQGLQAEIVAMLEGMVRTEVNLERPSFEKRLAKAVDKAGAKLAAPIKKTILNVMSERDEMAEVCVDAEGNPEPDPELRDYENVPLKEDIYTYLEREVKPHVDWVKSEGTFRWDPFVQRVRAGLRGSTGP